MLITTPNIIEPDEFYQALVDAHRGLTEADSHQVNAKLVLLLANHIGDLAVIRQALNAAIGKTPKSDNHAMSKAS